MKLDLRDDVNMHELRMNRLNWPKLLLKIKMT